ncbi:MAG TPA: alpha/beta hydrolase-fold protein [Candidatus Limnocylindria bacterium]|nr:alpha/beta hydrolase-fold protein [Candidatus Limnocylindria bacterium]
MRVLMPDEPRAVLFLNDGQNLFTRPRTVGTPEKWRADEAAARVPGLAIVGIDNAGRQRARDYLPYPNASDPLGRRPRGGRYADFIVEELFGWVARRYPQLARPRHVGIGGSSYGAVSALHTALRHPGAFDRLLVESPSLFISGRRLLDDVRLAPTLPQRVHLAMGTAEARAPETSARVLQDAVDLADLLRSKGLGPRRLHSHIEQDGRHHERYWAGRLPGALRFLFG